MAAIYKTIKGQRVKFGETNKVNTINGKTAEVGTTNVVLTGEDISLSGDVSTTIEETINEINSDIGDINTIIDSINTEVETNANDIERLKTKDIEIQDAATVLSNTVQTLASKSVIRPSDEVLSWNETGLRAHISLIKNAEGKLQLVGKRINSADPDAGYINIGEAIDLDTNLSYSHVHSFDGENWTPELLEDMEAPATAQAGDQWLILGFTDAGGVTNYSYANLTKLIPEALTAGNGIAITDKVVSLKLNPDSRKGLVIDSENGLGLLPDYFDTVAELDAYISTQGIENLNGMTYYTAD